jgi:hypothetical protein
MVISSRLNAILDQLEMQRLAQRRRALAIFNLLLILAVAAPLGLHVAGADNAALVVLIVCAILIAATSARYRKRLTVSFRQRVMPELVREISPTLEYRAAGCISETEFDSVSLWRSCDRYSGRDLVHGEVGDTDVRFSLVHAEERYETTSTDSEGRTTRETHYRTLFRGVFMSLDFNKAFAKRTWVRPQPVGWLNRLSRSHVAMEDPRFNELFTVTSSDQIEARYLLTPALMGRLQHLRKRLGNFSLAFRAGRLHLAVDRPYGLFDPNVAERFNGTKQIGKMLHNLRSMTEIVSDLDLNTRIWSKQPCRADLAGNQEAGAASGHQ